MRIRRFWRERRAATMRASAYLSLNRGEGGQNIIGTELFDALGVIRTEELLQARRLDGGEQFFTRTFDFGFSKRRDEAAMRWNEREVLGDMVRVIRMFRPLVIHSRWGGTAADGHGHHQLAGYLTPLAFKAAADPNEFPEQLQEGLRPVADPQAVYPSARRGAGHDSGADRRLRSRARPHVCRDRVRRPQPAQVAESGHHRNTRTARLCACARSKPSSPSQSRSSRSSTDWTSACRDSRS